MDIKQLYSGAEKEAFYPKVKLNSIEDTVNGKTIEQNLQQLGGYGNRIDDLGTTVNNYGALISGFRDDLNTIIQKVQNLNTDVFGTATGQLSNTTKIDTVPEVYSFLNGYNNSQKLRDILNNVGGGNAVSYYRDYNIGERIGVLTIDNQNIEIKIPDSLIATVIDRMNLNLTYDNVTNILSLKRGNTLLSSVQIEYNDGDTEKTYSKPNPPTNFAATYNSNNNSILLTWNPAYENVTNATEIIHSYIISISNSGNAWSTNQNVLILDDNYQYLIPNVTQGVTYTFTIRSKSVGGDSLVSDPSAAVTCVVPAAAPVVPILSAPYDLDAESTPNGSIYVSWTEVNGAYNYKVQRKIGSGEWQQVATVEDGDYEDSGIQNMQNIPNDGVIVYYRVCTVNTENIAGSWSDPASITILPKLDAPTNLTATYNSSNNSVLLQWDLVTGASQYMIAKQPDSLNSNGYYVQGDINGFTDLNVTRGTTYTYIVKTVDSSNRMSDTYSRVVISIPSQSSYPKALYGWDTKTNSGTQIYNDILPSLKQKEVSGMNGETFQDTDSKTADPQSFYIAAPSNLSQPTRFTMIDNGYESAANFTLFVDEMPYNGTTYKVYILTDPLAYVDNGELYFKTYTS